MHPAQAQSLPPRTSLPNSSTRAGKTKTLLLALIAAWLVLPASGQRLSPLENPPEWSQLDRFQETISRADFERLLDEIYAPFGAWKDFVRIDADSARIAKTLHPPTYFTLRFGAGAPPQYWRPVATLDPAPESKPLDGLHIAIDPGHIGGKWARMEERWFQIAESPPVTEGDMTLLVARKVKAHLEQLGAHVTLVRDSASPITRDSPAKLRDAARAELTRRGITHTRESYTSPTDPDRYRSVQWQSELLFYRASEIRARAERINRTIKPDLVLCLHFNAEAWGDPDTPDVVPENHLHLLVNGCYMEAELVYDDIRFGMIEQLLSRTARESIAVSDTVAKSMARETGLPPYVYTGRNAIRVGDSGYVWARNLLANRLYLCPVIYLEPYVMNNREVFQRIQMGDYEGTRTVNGTLRKSIFNEYAESLVDGLVRHIRTARSR